MASSWSDLLPELLPAVFNNLNDARDILNCATVCNSWRDSSSVVYSRKFVPFLVVSHPSSDEEIGEISDEFFKILRNDLRLVCGCSRGFLLTIDGSSPFEVHLHNPFTKTVTSLPPLISLEDVQWLLQSQAICETLDSFVKKAVSSSTSLLDPNWVVVIIYNTDRKLAFCRDSDRKWTDLESDQVDDIVFCNGVFFAINKTGEIYHYKLTPNNSNPKATTLCSTSPFRFDFCKKYLAESASGRELWVILKKLELDDFTTYFEIYEFISEIKEWRMVTSLRGKALFLSSRGGCIAVSASETGARGFIKDNSVYFIDGNEELGRINLSVFEWESKQIREIYQPSSWNCHMFWI